MKAPARFHRGILCATSWIAFLLLARVSPAADDVTATLTPEKQAIMLGEPASASLTIKNNSPHTVSMPYPVGDDYSSSFEDGGVDLTAVDKAGVKVPAPPREHYIEDELGYSGFSREATIQPGGVLTLRLWLPKRIAFDHAGSYTLTATAKLFSFEKGQGETGLTATATAPIEVVPLDKDKMEKLIDDSEKAVLATSFTIINGVTPAGYEEGRTAYCKLEYINDERVIPFFRRQMRNGDFVTAMHALAKFDNDDALDSLKDGLEITEIINPASHKPDQSALMQVHVAACRDLVLSPHPGALPYLVSQRKNPDLQVRIKIMQAVAAKLPPKEALPILEEMQHDPQAWVGDYAKRYLEEIKVGKKPVTGEFDAPAPPAERE